LNKITTTESFLRHRNRGLGLLNLPINGDFKVVGKDVTLQSEIFIAKMRAVLKIFLMAIAYLALFILGAWSGAIHPACYAYIGALLPLLSAFIYLIFEDMYDDEEINDDETDSLR